MKNTNKKGFTLVELVIVIAVIAILAGVLIATFASVIKKANDSARLQQAKNDEIAQKADDIIAKIENSNWFGWEDFEAEIVKAVAEAAKSGQLSLDEIKPVVEDAVKTALANIKVENTGLTAEDVKAIVENAMGSLKFEGVTEAQVRAIVNGGTATLLGNQLTAAQVRSIVNAANEQNLTAVQLANVLSSQLSGVATLEALNAKMGDLQTAITGATANLATKEDVQTILDTIENFETTVNSADLDDVITAKALNIRIKNAGLTSASYPYQVFEKIGFELVPDKSTILLSIENGQLGFFVVDEDQETIVNSCGLTITTVSYKHWTFTNTLVNAKCSTYLTGVPSENPVEVNGVGIDVGQQVVTAINYTNTGDPHDVVIRTSSASTTLTISDESTGSIYHYGLAGALNIIQCHTASYHENGKVAYAEIAKGRIVLENGSKVEEIHVNKKTDSSFDTVIIANNGGAEELPERITRDAVTVSEETLVVKVESNGTSENVYVYGDGGTGTKGSTQKITEGENKQNENVNSALGQLVLDNGASSDKAQTPEEKQVAKDETIEEAVVEEIETSDKYVARIGTTPFESLKDAVASANANDIIEMTANDIDNENVSVDKPVTINMNDKTFGGTIVVATTGTNAVTIVGQANIDAVIKYGNKYFNSFVSVNNATVVLLKDITLTNISVGPNKNFTYDLNGHTITLTKSDSSEGAIYLQNNYQEYDGARLTIKDGNLNFTGTGSSSVGIFAYGELNLSNVNITSTCEYAIETQPDAYCGKGIVNINGGSITTAKTAINATAANDKHPTVSLNGVEIIETGSKKPLLAYGAVMEITDCVVRTSSSEPVLQVGHSAIGGSPSQVTINSGTFDGSITKEEGHFLFIKGGNFKSNPTALVNTSVYDINLNDGYYVVSLNEANVVCSIDGIYYSSIEQAILDRPNDGKTIMLLKNSSEEIVVQQMANFQIDENGHSFTGSISAGEGYNMTVMNGHYMITPPPQARIGSNDYLTLGEAIKAILKGQEASGASITLLSDTDVETVQISKPSSAKTFTIVTNGFAINTTLKAPSGWTSIYIIANGSYHSISNGSTFSLASLGDVEVRIQ